MLYGPESIKDSLGSLSFHISAQAFFQVNSEQAEKLYNKALEFAALSGKETVVDVYCGTGTISLYLARHAKQVYGIEIVAPAIENAKKNAEENKCANAEFICGDAAVELPKLLASGVRPDVLVVILRVRVMSRRCWQRLPRCSLSALFMCPAILRPWHAIWRLWSSMGIRLLWRNRWICSR